MIHSIVQTHILLRVTQILIILVLSLPLHALALDVPLWIDFDESNGNTHIDYISCPPAVYTPARGFGWDKTVSAISYWSYDYNYHIADGHRSKEDATFQIDIPNGKYTLYLGIAPSSRDGSSNYNVDIIIEGQLRLDNFSPSHGRMHVKKYDVEVNDNALNITFGAGSGGEAYWIINSLRLRSQVEQPAPPIVSNVSGSVTPNGTLTISGADFGQKAPAEPILFDDFEHCANNGELASSSNWNNYNQEKPAQCSSTQAYSGNIAAHNYITSSNGQSFATANYFFPETDVIYLTYKTRYDVQGNGYGVRKLSRLTSKGSSFSNLYNGVGTFDISNSSQGCSPAGCTLGYQLGMTIAEGATRYGPTYLGIPTGDWTRLDMYAALSTPGIKDGIIRYAKNSSVYWIDDQMITRGANQDFNFHSTILGIMMANAKEDGQHWMYVDDVYLDNTQKRVELCNISSWEQIEDFGALCEPQIPSSWSDSTIGVKVNQGGLDLSGPLFLFVINENGLASNSFPVNESRPRAPTGLHIINPL